MDLGRDTNWWLAGVLVTLITLGASLRPILDPGGPLLPSPRTAAAQESQIPQPVGSGAPRRLALGAFIGTAPAAPGALDGFAALVGRMPAIVHWYQAWGGASPAFSARQADAVLSRGATPMLTWEPWDTAAGMAQPAYALRSIAAGQHDAYIHEWASAAAAWGGPLYLRWAHEMNGDWYPWCIGVNGNTSADYVAAWRHVVDIFRQAGATNVRWVWSPNRLSTRTTSLADSYPGDGYVDWVALDGYNRGMDSGAWRSFEQLFGRSYDALAVLTNKPIMIAETASSEAGGDKATWIRDSLLQEVPQRFPRISALVWFHQSKASGDWRVDTSGSSLAAYRAVAASPLYQGRIP